MCDELVKLFSSTYLQSQSGKRCSNAVICPHPVLMDIAHGKTPATCFWTPAPSIFQSCSCWVPATCRCLLAGETCVPSCVLGMKWGANMTWGGEGKVLPSMTPSSSIPALAVQDYGLFSAAWCPIRIPVVSDLEIRLLSQVCHLKLSRRLKSHINDKTQARVGGNMRWGFKSRPQGVWDLRGLCLAQSKGQSIKEQRSVCSGEQQSFLAEQISTDQRQCPLDFIFKWQNCVPRFPYFLLTLPSSPH